MADSSKLSLISILGYVTVGLFSIIMILQLLLAAGVLPVSMAWGGRSTELTPLMRLSSLIAIIIFCYFTYMIARRSGILGATPPSRLINLGSWLVTVYLVFNTIMNFLSSSSAERWIFGPISLALVVLTLIINSNNTPNQGKQGHPEPKK